MKGVFGVRRVHVRGNQAVETELGFLLMSMNLTKLTKKLVRDYKEKQKPQTEFRNLGFYPVKFVCGFQLVASFCPASVFFIVNHCSLQFL